MNINLEDFKLKFAQLEAIIYSPATVEQKHHDIFYSGLADEICNDGLIVRDTTSSCNRTEIEVFYIQCKDKLDYLGGIA